MDSKLTDRLEILRGSRTQKEFAEWLGEGVTTVGSYFTGVSRPGIGFLESLAKKGVNLNWFVTGEGPVYRGEDERFAKLPPEAQVFLMELIQDGTKPENLPEIMQDLKKLREFNRAEETTKETLRLRMRVLKESLKGGKKRGK